MAKTTITEALAELKTIGKRLESKQVAMSGYMIRQERLKDPLEKDGGSVEFIARERQACADLRERFIRIRAAIAKANAETSITVGGVTRTVADWLIWRRDVVPDAKKFLTQIRTGIENARKQAQTQGLVMRRAGEEATKPDDIVVNVDEAGLARDLEAIEQVLGELDGRFSLTNAVTMIEIE